MLDYFNLAKQYGTPLYVYHQNTLKDRCHSMKNFADTLSKNLPCDVKVSMHYSSKANSNPAILSVVKEVGLKVDCMSPYELLVNEKCGFMPDQMLYVCNNISADEMHFVHDKGILICLDSVSQVETWGKHFPGTDIMVRINPGAPGVGHSEKVVTSGKETKFGISESSIPQLFEVAGKYNLNIIGTHQHLGSLFLNDKISDYIAGVKAGLDIVKRCFSDVKIVDLGGGFGVPYKPNEQPLDLSALTNELLPVLKEFVEDYPSVEEFKFEPGRYIPCEAGNLIGRVTATKHENNTWWIGTDIGMNQLVRPSMYDSYHEIKVITRNVCDCVITANFCGNVCESGDILGKNRSVHAPEIDDIVVVYNAGAYGYSMASNYTGRGRPAEVMIKDDGTTELIRKAENLLDTI
ncbi:MAG: diaminopimelate decarboxylase [Clostridiales bacterium]|nr:diaminopimelate decarboxylase [Clostridiales bacterium]